MNVSGQAGGMMLHSDVEKMALCAALVSLRLGGIFVFAPVLSSPALAMRTKATLVLAITVLITPGLLATAPAPVLSLGSVAGELSIGLTFGLAMSLLVEAVLFASQLLGMEFSFSLVNLIDPVSRVETPVLGQLLGWLTTLVLLGAGLHRTLLRAVLHSYAVLPPGRAAMSGVTAVHLSQAAGCIFLVGVQLAAPVLAAGLVVEVAIAQVSRMAPQITANVLSVPIKTIVSYTVLLASLALWPTLLERHFNALLSAAERWVLSA